MAQDGLLVFTEGGKCIRQIDTTDIDEIVRFQEFRYRWAVVEHKWVKPPRAGLPREFDVYDPHSEHFGVFDAFGDLVAYTRIILPSKVGLQLINEFGSLVDPIFYKIYNPSQAVEISRLLVAKDYVHGVDESYSLAQWLYKAVYQWCRIHQRYQWLVVAEKKFIRALSIQHFLLRIIGEGKQYQGAMCYPAVMDLRETIDLMLEKDPKTARWFNEGLE